VNGRWLGSHSRRTLRTSSSGGRCATCAGAGTLILARRTRSSIRSASRSTARAGAASAWSPIRRMRVPCVKTGPTRKWSRLRSATGPSRSRSSSSPIPVCRPRTRSSRKPTDGKAVWSVPSPCRWFRLPTCSPASQGRSSTGSRSTSRAWSAPFSKAGVKRRCARGSSLLRASIRSARKTTPRCGGT